MKTDSLDLPGQAKSYLKSKGYESLYPPQADCIDAGLLDGESLLVSAPTASGKTLIAILAMLSHLSGGRDKIVYLSPLRALAAEKFAEFKELEGLELDGSGRDKIRVSISTGDFDTVDKSLEKSDILVLTNEKMDSVLRHRAKWTDDIGLVIADEIHLIGDDSRGSALEMVLTRLKQGINPQILGLSATITNSQEIADWLECKLVQSDWRPVPLSEGVSDGNQVRMNNGENFEFKTSSRGVPVDLGLDSVIHGGQSLIFAETRTRCASLATKAASAVTKLLEKKDSIVLRKASRKILAENDNTEMVKALAALVRQGVAFHHAGLSQSCRRIVEDEFRKKTIKLLSSTPTLAAGVNLPARRVIVSSVSRYNPQEGRNLPISVLEYKQLCGRAGRPQFDDRGEAIIVGRGNVYSLVERFIDGTPEPIVSKMYDDRSLRVHILSAIVTNPGMTKDEILELFQNTFGGKQHGKHGMKLAVNVSLRFLSGDSFIVKKADCYTATRFGHKTSLLYIDPRTATVFRKALLHASPKRQHTLGFLHLISSCEEFFPRPFLRKGDPDAIRILLESYSSELIWPTSEFECSRSLLALHYWIAESSRISLSDSIGIESGDMYRMAESGHRLLYCLQEFARLEGRRDLLEELGSLGRRILYGINKDLLELVSIRGIGRVRARALYRNGIRGIDDIAGASVSKLAGIGKIGTVTANNIKSQALNIRR